MDDLNKTAEDDDKNLKKKNKGTKLPTFGFKDNKSGLPIPVSQTGLKNGRPVSASQRPSTPKFRKKHVVQPQADIIRKTPEKATLNRFGFHGNAQMGFTNKVADSKQSGGEGAVRVKINSLTATTEPITVSSKFTETHFLLDSFSQVPRGNTMTNNVKSVKTGIPAPARVTLQSSHLPRPQYPIKLGRPGSAAEHGSPQKHAKMIANNEAKARSRSCPKTKQLERKNSNNQSRLEMSTHKDGLEVTEMIPLPAARNRSSNQTALARHNERLKLRSQVNDMPATNNFEFSSSSDEEDSAVTQGEEKMSRDIMRNEKSAISLAMLGCDQWNEGEGEGEAMATDLLPDGSSPDDIRDQIGIPGVDKPLRSVLLTIEDQAFAVLAALSSTELIENETPDDLMSISPPLSEANDFPSSKPSSLQLGKGSSNSGTGSPCTPSHPSHSLSICSDERDYFDDEIADQPGLVFDDDTEPITSSAGLLSSSGATDDTVKILDNNHSRNAQSYVCHLLNMSTNQCQSSMYTSSPCESIISDDLILDYNRNDSSFSLELDNDSRLANSSLRTSNGTLQSNFVSGSISPCSALSSSPFRSSRNSNINSSFENSFSDSGIRLDQNTYQHLFQDIVSIKTMLLRLKRVLTQNELQINLSSPSIKYYDSDEQDQLLDLKRQLILLQQEMEEKNRKIFILESQIEKYSEKTVHSSMDLFPLEKSTSATQTERIKA